MVSVDPQNNRIYVMDAGAGKIAGVNLQNGKLSAAWTQDQTTLSFTTLIGPKNQRVLIGTNIPVKTFQGLKHYTTKQVIWRNAQTGKELASSSQFPKMTQALLVTPGYAGRQILPHRRRPHHRPAMDAENKKAGLQSADLRFVSAARGG